MPNKKITIKTQFNDDMPILLIAPYSPEQVLRLLNADSPEEECIALLKECEESDPELRTFEEAVSACTARHKIAGRWVADDTIVVFRPHDVLEKVRDELEPRYNTSLSTYGEFKRYTEEIEAAEQEHTERVTPERALH